MNFSNHIMKRLFGLLVLMVLIAGAALPSVGQRRRPRLRKYPRPAVKTVTPSYYTVQANQLIRVRMNSQISSESARVGDQFTTTVVDPIYAGGVEVIPAASTITGRVTTVNRAARRSKAGSMGVRFVALRLPNGTSRAINGELTDVETSSARSDSEGEVSGRSATKRNVVFIGGGAATGALIGAIAGGGKGAGIGAGVGAGLGAAGAFFSKGHEAVVKPGTEFGVVLNQSIVLPAANVRSLQQGSATGRLSVQRGPASEGESAGGFPT